MRQRLKSRIKPRGRPHLKQRLTVRLENLGFREALIIIDFLAMNLRRPKRRSGDPAPSSSLALRANRFSAWSDACVRPNRNTTPRLVKLGLGYGVPSRGLVSRSLQLQSPKQFIYLRDLRSLGTSTTDIYKSLPKLGLDLLKNRPPTRPVKYTRDGPGSQ